MATKTPQPGKRESKLSETRHTSSNTSLTVTQQPWRPQLVHSHTSNAAGSNMTQDAYSEIVRKAESHKQKMQ